MNCALLAVGLMVLPAAVRDTVRATPACGGTDATPSVSGHTVGPAPAGPISFAGAELEPVALESARFGRCPGRAGQSRPFPFEPVECGRIPSETATLDGGRRGPHGSAIPPAGDGRDPWFGSDKLRHFLTAFAVTGYAHAGLRALDVDRDAAITAGALVSLAAGIGKEIHDVRSGSFFSLRDLVWDLAGTLAGAALVLRAR